MRNKNKMNGEKIINVRIFRFDETQQNSLINANAKNKKNHKDIIRLKNDTPIDQKPTNPEEAENVEKENTNVDLDADTNELISIDTGLFMQYTSASR